MESINFQRTSQAYVDSSFQGAFLSSTPLIINQSWSNAFDFTRLSRSPQLKFKWRFCIFHPFGTAGGADHLRVEYIVFKIWTEVDAIISSLFIQKVRRMRTLPAIPSFGYLIDYQRLGPELDELLLGLLVCQTRNAAHVAQ